MRISKKKITRKIRAFLLTEKVFFKKDTHLCKILLHFKKNQYNCNEIKLKSKEK